MLCIQSVALERRQTAGEAVFVSRAAADASFFGLLSSGRESGYIKKMHAEEIERTTETHASGTDKTKSNTCT